MTDLTIGTAAPDVTLPRDGGDMITLADIQGPVVLYFYPKDDTPGCTKEAIGFTEHLEGFAASGATILGISKDTVAKHEKFIAKHDLKIALLSDADGDVCERFGVWVEKNMYGKQYMGIERATFLISGGKIARIWRKVKVPGHVDEVLDAVRAL
ncbi:MAG: peroxiredoxin [Octadecabacter sp.]|jgi:peroxiredoxin Q/BCP|nr:peroxiredoxin [Octadecabacter sp.]|tara:strand:- start:18 stop:479 length:462 start_codon:yes stop_codon:yes gene_type:complete